MKRKIIRIALSLILLGLFVSPAVLPDGVARASTETLRPNGVGDYTNIAGQYPASGSHWDKVDETSQDADGTYVQISDYGDAKDAYALQDTSIPVGSTINSVTVYYVFGNRYAEIYNAYARPLLRLSGAETFGTSVDLAYYSWKSGSQTLARPGGGVWTVADLNSLQVGEELFVFSRCTQIYVVVDYTLPPEAPTVTTSAATSTTNSTATLNGNVTNTGGENPTVIVYWGTNDGGTDSGNWTNNSTPTSPAQPQGVAVFYYNATGLIPNTLYYFSANATNSAGTSWGTSQNFTTSVSPPIVTTQAVSDIVGTTATGNGNITDIGGENPDIRGVCWNTTGTPTFTDSKQQETGSFNTGAFIESMTGLVHSTIYYVRAYAHNSGGYSYGSTVNFTTGDTIPILATLAASSVNTTFALGSGNVTDLGGTANCTIWGVEWGTVTGVYTANTTQSGSQGLGAYTSNMTPLNPSTTYYYRAKAYNAQGWGYGGQESFTTAPVTPPVVITVSVSDVNPTYATLQGSLISLGSSTFVGVSFEFGTTTSYGSTTPESQLTAIGTFSYQKTGLSYSTTYHFRARVSYGLYYAYGADISFTTAPAAGSSTSLSIVSARVFNNYMSPDNGDLLVVIEARNTYTGKYPNQKPGDHFTVQLLGTNDIDILGASPLANWGDRPASIYFNPTVATTLTDKSAYYVKMIGDSSSGYVSAEYQLQPSDWKGYDLTGLDSWCIGTAKLMSVSDSVAISTYVINPTDINAQITDVAGGYFTSGIPGIGQVRPYLFTTAQYKTAVTAGVANNWWDKLDFDPAGWRSYVGTTIATDVDLMAFPFGISGKSLMEMVVIIIILGCVMVVVSGTGGFGALGALLIAVPILWLGTYFRIVHVAIIILMVIGFGLLAIRQFVVKTL